MKRIATLFVMFLVHVSAYGVDTTREITELYVNATGNNKFEAQVKANIQGVERAFFIILDKMGFSKNDIDQVPYLVLKDVFSISEVKKESATDGSYSAMLSYRYDLYLVNQLLQAYGHEVVQDKFYEYLVIPVFKQKNIISLWEGNNEWIKQWGKSRKLSGYYKLYYPNATMPVKKLITARNVFNLTYDACLDIFSNFLFKKVLILVSEYFTDPVTGNVVMNVKNIILEHGNKVSTSEIDYLLNDPQDSSKVVSKSISDIMAKYGSLRHDVPKSIHEKIDIDENRVRTLMLNIDTFNEEEIKNIERKLKNVSEIKKFEVRRDYGSKYKITIWTEADDYSLTEGFYLNGLSFKIYGNLYNLIDIKEGA